MLVNRLAWRNKFLVDSALTLKKDYHHAVVLSDLPCFLLGMESIGFSTVWFLGHNSKPGFCLLFDPLEEVLVVCDFTQQFLAGRHTQLLLLV
jgi:hypothetical protein